jgi:hypothetical protein
MSLMAQDVIDKEVQKAVTGLASRLISPMKVYIRDIIQAGTKDMTSELSVCLNSSVKHHAVNTPMFDVEDETSTRGQKDEPSTGIITGIYNTRGRSVEVVLELKVDNRVRSSQRFTVPVSELEKMGISIVPDNFKDQNDALKQDNDIKSITDIVKQPEDNQVVKIQAWFDSQLGSRVFMHSETLVLKVMADKDCYFKIIHIDVDKHMKMIYPNSVETNNRLIANTERSLFEKTNYYFYEPYGAETLLFIASVNQFENIENDYISPWTAESITPENFRKVLRGSRGLELEKVEDKTEILVDGEARYTITILKPNEEYEYGKPESMRDFIQIMRNDTERQGGTWDSGNTETKGFSVLNNVRVSYRVPQEKPDTIQFAIYNLNNITPAARRVGGNTRGAGHTFSFEKPGNILQAIQDVKSGIIGKGGSFTGNDQNGNFTAKGIEGQYRVSEMVNVTITAKPALIPNSLIEKEVKNFFGK